MIDYPIKKGLFFKDGQISFCLKGGVWGLDLSLTSVWLGPLILWRQKKTLMGYGGAM
jgi:hypothetical protein